MPADVRDEHRDLHDVPQTGAARLEDATHVLEAATGLPTDVVRPDELAVLVERKLSGDVDGIPDPPAMRVARSRVGHVRWLDRGTCHCVSPQGSTGHGISASRCRSAPRACRSGRFFPRRAALLSTMLTIAHHRGGKTEVDTDLSLCAC